MLSFVWLGAVGPVGMVSRERLSAKQPGLFEGLMREPDLVFDFQTRNGWPWQITGWSGGIANDLGRGRMEVRAVVHGPEDTLRPFGHMIVDEAADPQVTTNGIIDWLESIP